MGDGATESTHTKILEAGDFATVTRGASVQQTPISSHNHLPLWRQSAPSFENVSLSEVIDELEQLYAIKIQPDEEINLNQEIYYLSPKAVTAETILSDICKIAGLQYRPIHNGFEIISAVP